MDDKTTLLAVLQVLKKYNLKVGKSFVTNAFLKSMECTSNIVTQNIICKLIVYRDFFFNSCPTILAYRKICCFSILPFLEIKI